MMRKGWLLVVCLGVHLGWAEPTARFVAARPGPDGRMIYPVSLVLAAPDSGGLALQSACLQVWNRGGRVIQSQSFDARALAEWTGNRLELRPGQQFIISRNHEFWPSEQPARLAYVLKSVATADGHALRQTQWFKFVENEAALPDVPTGQPRFEVRCNPDKPEGLLLPRSRRTIYGFDLCLQETAGVPVTLKSLVWQARNDKGEVLQQGAPDPRNADGEPLVCAGDGAVTLSTNHFVLAANQPATELAIVAEGTYPGVDGQPVKVVAAWRTELVRGGARLGKTAIRWPFAGQWQVTAGLGESPNLGTLRYGWVFARYEKGRLFAGDGSLASQHYAWRQKVLAPAAGVVKATMCEKPDAEQGGPGGVFAPGAENYILVEHAGGEISYLGGLRQGSARVTVGMKVESGQELAEVGSTCSTGRVALVYRLCSPMRAMEPQTLMPLFVPYKLSSAGQTVDSTQAPETLELVSR